MAAWSSDHDGGNNRAVQDQLKEVDAFLGQILSRAKRRHFWMNFFGSHFLYQNWVGNSSNYRFWNHVWPFEAVSKVEKSVRLGGMLGNTPNRPRLYCTSSAFAAVLWNGRVVTWGNNLFGGDSGAVQDQLKDVRKIESTLGKQPQVIQAVIFGNPQTLEVNLSKRLK